MARLEARYETATTATATVEGCRRLGLSRDANEFSSGAQNSRVRVKCKSLAREENSLVSRDRY